MRIRQISCLLAALALPTMAAVPAATPAPSASWDLTELYATPEAWSSEYQRVKTAVAGLGRFRGTLGRSASELFTAMDTISNLTRDTYRLMVYAGLKADEDLRVAANQERDQLAKSLGTAFSEQTAWVSPEILGVGADRIRSFIRADDRLNRRFGFQLENTLRAAPHTLGEQAEDVLAKAGDLLQQPNALHDLLANAELPFPEVSFADGRKVTLTTPNYEKYRQGANRAERKQVFDAFWGGWKKFEGTFGTMLTAQVMANSFNAKSRKYGSSLEAALFPDNMPQSVYRMLVAETNAALPTLHRYLKLRKRLLGITDELRYYDNYAPLFSIAKEPVFSLAESERLTLQALQPLGEDYLGLLRQGFAGRWMSGYPATGKKSGAYMNGSAYDVHPYLLLNHNDDFSSLSTLAHEWGHAVHTLLANRAQPFEKASYSTFTAESASIGNEMLLSDYMVEHAANREQKLFYLGRAVETIRQTYFRQVMFAEFELAIHEELETGKPLSGERMSELYCGLLRKYYGEAEGVMKIDPAYCLEWTYVPHFYYNFYLYQYATSIAGAAYLTEAIHKEGTPARERFLDLLRAGGSDYPYELYNRAGVDMATPTAYRALMTRMNRLLDEIEQLEKQGGR